jgi:hypothetical protein
MLQVTISYNSSYSKQELDVQSIELYTENAISCRGFRMIRTAALLIVGLIILGSGGIILLEINRIVVNQDDGVQEIGLLPDPGFDLDFSLFQSEAAQITIEYNSTADAGIREVWPMISYRFPSKMVLEAVTRYINESEVSFTLGWENTTYANIFVTGFAVRVFYYGSNVVQVNYTITILGDPNTTYGIGMIVLSCIPFWSMAIVHRKEPTMNFPNQELVES